MRVIEIDMSFPFLMYFIQIEMSSFRIFSFILSCALVVTAFGLTVAHCLPEESEKEKKFKLFLKLVFKIVNVSCTMLSFFHLIIVSDFHFDIGEDVQEILETLT